MGASGLCWGIAAEGGGGNLGKGVGGGVSDLVFRALCVKGSWVVPRRVFDGGTGVAHVFWGRLALLGRQAEVKAAARRSVGADGRRRLAAGAQRTWRLAAH